VNTKKILVTLGFVLLSAAGLSGCGRNHELTRISSDNTNLELLPDSEPENEISPTSQLTALADTQEAAQEIADLYGIELKSFSFGVATYTTDKNLREILDLGLENGYPELTPDFENQLYNTQTPE